MVECGEIAVGRLNDWATIWCVRQDEDLLMSSLQDWLLQEHVETMWASLSPVYVYH